MSFSNSDLTSNTSNTKTIQLSADSDTIELPSADFVRDADMSREGMDLVLETPQGTIVIQGYFAAEPAPNLTAPDGSTLTPDMVDAFAANTQFAQAGSMMDISPVGAIQEVSGEATVTRIDGTVESVSIGTPIFQGDIVETNDEGAVNIVFIDETSFAVSEDARLAIDEYIFDPATQSGSTNFSVLKGVFVFTSGLIGRDDPDDVSIDTPVGSIGIRGTIIAGDVTNGEITVIEGAIVLRDFSGNEMTLANQFETARFGGANGGIENVGQLSAADVAGKFASVSNVSPSLFSSINDAAQEAGEDSGADAGDAQDAGDGDKGAESTTDGEAPADAQGEAGAEGQGEPPADAPASDAPAGDTPAANGPAPGAPGDALVGGAGDASLAGGSGGDGLPPAPTGQGPAGGDSASGPNGGSAAATNTAGSAGDTPPPPPIFKIIANSNPNGITENNAGGELVARIRTTADSNVEIGQIIIDDADADDVTIVKNNNGAYEIRLNPNNPIDYDEMKANGELNANDEFVVNYTVISKDGALTRNGSFNLKINNVLDEFDVEQTLALTDIDEDAAAGTLIATIDETSDSEISISSVTIESKYAPYLNVVQNSTNGTFQIVTATAGSLDYETLLANGEFNANGEITVGYTATGTNGSTYNGTLNFKVDDITERTNTAPAYDPKIPDAHLESAVEGHRWYYHFDKEFNDSDGDDLLFQLTPSSYEPDGGSLSAISSLDDVALDAYLDRSQGTNGWNFDSSNGFLELFFKDGITQDIDISFIIQASDDNGTTWVSSSTYTVTAADATNTLTFAQGADIINETIYDDQNYSDPSIFHTLSLGESAAETNNRIYMGDGKDSVMLAADGDFNDIFLGDGENTATISQYADNNTIVGGFDQDTFYIGYDLNKTYGMDGDDKFVIQGTALSIFEASDNNNTFIDGGWNNFRALELLDNSTDALLSQFDGQGTGASIQDGRGDELYFDTSGSNIDFSAFQYDSSGDSRIENIEQISFDTGTANLVTLTYQQVIDMTEDDNVLIINLDATDTLTFNNEGNSFTKVEDNAQLDQQRGYDTTDADSDGISDSANFKTYDIYSDGTVTLLIEDNGASASGILPV